ncbi:MAG: DUF4038 domain-containing protein [Armatimonadetes bacterium]|nr:DUF4038 domain-containing protein [Armatimonadota bacterium]
MISKGVLFLAALFSAAASCSQGREEMMKPVQTGHPCELELTAERDYDNPLWDVAITVTFTAPSGTQTTVEGFWDGGRTWKVRFTPWEPGSWEWTSASQPPDPGLAGKRGAFECRRYDGDNPAYRRGPLKVSEDRAHLEWADGTPFFWLADTAWNGVLGANKDDWWQYLRRRREQGFTAVQFVCTHWRGFSRDAAGERAWEGTEQVRINPSFFRRMDAKVAMINEAGLIAAPVILWACTPPDPGQSLPEADAIRVARYIVARWGAYNVVWFLGGDGVYTGEKAQRWKNIGRAVFGDRHDRLVTMHPGGMHWPYDEIGAEPWLDFWGYQSSHGRGEPTQKWLTQGPPAQAWKRPDRKPIINLEPNYEAHPNGHGRVFSDRDVRQALYWSLLVSPTAGVTYGHNWIWPWRETPGEPEGHPYIHQVGAWHEAVEAPGAQQLRHLRAFFESIPWWRLAPAPELLSNQPGAADVDRFVAVAATADLSAIVVFTPHAQPVELTPQALSRHTTARWFNPRTGEWSSARVHVAGPVVPPADGDWLLLVTRNG